MQIDIISDFVCPWCIIGKERLLKVLAMRPNFKVEINFRPFSLHHEVPLDGVDFQKHYIKKFGSEIALKGHINTIREAGFNEGFKFNYELIKRVPNTLKAHALHRFAKPSGKADQIIDAILSAYFIEGRDIGELSVLLEIAKAHDLDAIKFNEEILEGVILGLVSRDIGSAVQMGVRVVPSFILNKQYVITGVKEPFDLLQIIETAYFESQEAEANLANAPASAAQTPNLS
jgi:predicted DsbA family dithiol-disulfide isomerase